VLGAVADVAAQAQRYGVAQAIIAMPEATHGERKRAVDLCTAAGIMRLTVPALSDIVSGRVSVSALRPIELDDLLGRDPVQLDEAGLQGFFGGKTVLVTGAGGSIGAELCRQIVRFGRRGWCSSSNRNFRCTRSSRSSATGARRCEIVAAIGDAKNEARVAESFARYRPDIVFHAAAYKHVPLMEEDNAFEAVRNNVLSTLVVARAARDNGAGSSCSSPPTRRSTPPTSWARPSASRSSSARRCRARRHAIRHRALRQRARLDRQRGAALPRADRARRPGHRHAPRHRALLHVDPEAAQLVLQAGQMGRAARSTCSTWASR
jgi:FlaA1/EpsC-like NDP-sugar epimerase